MNKLDIDKVEKIITFSLKNEKINKAWRIKYRMECEKSDSWKKYNFFFLDKIFLIIEINKNDFKNLVISINERDYDNISDLKKILDKKIFKWILKSYRFL